MSQVIVSQFVTYHSTLNGCSFCLIQWSIAGTSGGGGVRLDVPADGQGSAADGDCVAAGWDAGTVAVSRPHCPSVSIHLCT